MIRVEMIYIKNYAYQPGRRHENGVMKKMNDSSNPVERFRIEPQTGAAFTIKQGQKIRIIRIPLDG